MRTLHFLPATACTVLLMTALACSGPKGTDTAAATDEVRLDSCTLTDTTGFIKGNGERCAIYATANITFPDFYKDKTVSEQLQRLFAAFVLNAPDSLDLHDAMRATVSNTLHQYDFVDQWSDDTEDDSGAPVVYEYRTVTSVTRIYNKNQIITFGKTEKVEKNGNVTSVTHRYYNFDLKSMNYIDLHQLFRDEAIGDVTRLLRAKLLQQNNAQNDDQLNDMGYFNVDNLAANRNFYFSDQGITWSFMPGQLAVDAVGEPQIMLTYDELSPFMCEGSIISRIN